MIILPPVTRKYRCVGLAVRHILYVRERNSRTTLAGEGCVGLVVRHIPYVRERNSRTTSRIA
jgi:hypothetical protein